MDLQRMAKPLEKLSKGELCEICDNLKVEYKKRDTKIQLVDKLKEIIEGDADLRASIIGDGDDFEVIVDEEIEDVEDEDEEEPTIIDSELAEDVDEAEDQDYSETKFSLTTVTEPIVEFYESFYSKLLECTDKIGITTVKFSDSVRENLSSVIILNFLSNLAEFVVLVSTFIDLTTFELDINGSFTFDVFRLVNCKNLSILASWIVLQNLLPLAVAYYVNFTRLQDSTRRFEFDPFIFQLFKTLIYYIVSAYTFKFSFKCECLSCVNEFLLTYLNAFKLFANVLGPLPVIGGLTIVLISLYSQFEY